jgi:hypothetical protein
MLNPLTLLIIVGSLSVGILLFIAFFKLNKGAGVKNTPFTLTPVSDDNSPRGASKRMVKALCMNRFFMHILTNKASRFNDRVSLKRYKSYIQNPSVIDYIKGVKGWDGNE